MVISYLDGFRCDVPYEGWLTANYILKTPPSNFIAGRPGGFRCGVPLFIVILLICEYKNS